MIAVVLGVAAALAVALAGLRLMPRRGRGRALRRRLPRRAVIGLAAMVVGLMLWPPLCLAAMAWWLVAPTARRHRDRARRDRAVARALPDVTDLLVVAVQAGLTPYLAVEALAPVAPVPFDDALAAVLARHRSGQRLAVAVGALVEVAGERARPLARAIGDEDGLPLGPRLDHLRADARAERRRLSEAAARRLPITLSFPLAACILPAFVLLTVVPLLVSALSRLRF